MPPPVGVPCCRPGIHGVAPTVRQQGTPTGGSRCARYVRLYKSPALPWSSAESLFQRFDAEVNGIAGFSGQCRGVPVGRIPFCRVCYRMLGMRSVKNGKLFEDIPARSFCRLAQHALHPVKHGRRVRPTGTPRHGSFAQTFSAYAESGTYPISFHGSARGVGSRMNPQGPPARITPRGPSDTQTALINEKNGIVSMFNRQTQTDNIRQHMS
jgi:hypothetical protein